MEAVLYNRRRKTIERRHPWVYSGAIKRVNGTPNMGDIVTLISEDGAFLGRGLWSPESEIRLRILTWEDEPIDDAFWEFRIQRALSLRGPTPSGEARRLVNAENDFLPGLIIDQYGEWLVMQALIAGVDKRKKQIAEIAQNLVGASGVYERSDSEVRAKEGLEEINGQLTGRAVPELVEISENGHRFLVDIHHGHKTGFYLDQRENRRILSEWLLPGSRVLNCFAYTGGFSVYALGAGANEVISVDSSAAALEIAGRNLQLNNFPTMPMTVGDVFEVLRGYRDGGETFDAIILDPPKFAKTPRQVESALRGYKDINLLAWQLLRPGGMLLTFSCSGAVETELFRKVVFGALEDSRRDAQVIKQLEAPSDHPVALTFPEGQYLKGLLCLAV